MTADMNEVIEVSQVEETTTGLEVAIIGAAGRFPGARDLAELWRNLRDGIESISSFTRDELEEGNPGLLDDPRYVRARGVLADADLFDAPFFGYSPREAEIIDPQQRIFLECAWQALEDAGYDMLRYQRLVGIYAGSSTSSYAFNILSNPELLRQVGSTQLMIANDKDFLCSRAAYKLGLEGPSVVVQAACSTSLIAVHLACQALLAGECDMALAGGVSVVLPQRRGYLYQENGIFSPDGHCRTFDAEARGTVSGNGIGIVVLKRLADAVRDGDTIRAVVKGSAINNDGALRAGYTAPREAGQAKVIRAAHRAAEVAPGSIDYLEAHGTATELGDPIEVAAATQAFGTATGRKGFCAIGSIKTNVGHLDAAAGIAGLLKAVLALQHGLLPPSLHFEHGNPQIDFAASPFYVNTRLAEWPARSGPRRAGVSSFGLGGANAHVVLEERPPEPPAMPARPWQLILLSARTSNALEAATAGLAEHLREHPELALADAAYTSQVGRRRFEHRRVVVCDSLESAARDLAARTPGRVLTRVRSQGAPPVAYLLSGVGDHYVDMGLGLYRTEPVFRTEIDRCARLLEPELGLDLRDVLYPGRTSSPALAAPGGLDLRAMLRPATAALDEAGRKLQQTSLLQPAFLVLEYALAQLWKGFGIPPEAMLGYSLGEYAAACLAGVLSLEDSLVLVARRARMLDRLPPGAMLAVPLAEREIEPYLAGGLSLAAVNARDVSVLAGPAERIAALEAELRQNAVPCRRLQTDHAFHSTMMEPLAAPLRELVASFRLRAPSIPYLSNVTGTWITAAQATDPAYWARHLCSTVRFADGIAELGRKPRILLEIGPGQSLGSLALQQLAGEPGAERIVLASMRNVHDLQADEELLRKTLGGLWLAGAEIDWSGVHSGERRRRVSLPAYPFERQRYWVERRSTPPELVPEAVAAIAANRIVDPAGWFHAPSFRRAVRPAAPVASGAEPAARRRYLVLLDERGLGLRLALELAAAGHGVVTARAGKRFERLGAELYALRPDSAEDFASLFAELGDLPACIVHLFSLPETAAECRQELGFFSLLALAQALAQRPAAAAVDLAVVTGGVLAVESGESPLPPQATLLGPLRVIPQEFPALSCRLIDIGPIGPIGPRDLDLPAVERLREEIGRPGGDPLVALRGSHRWVPDFEPVPLAAAPGLSTPLRQGGVYLVTGGCGGIGLALAEFLARRFQAKLVLVGRSAVPARSDLAARLRALEEAGAEVLALSCDVTDREGMARAVALAGERFGRIDGVFHLAGLPGAGLIQVKDAAAAGRVLAVKMTGALVLAEALRGSSLDFMVLFSSLAAHVGGIGQADYSAANAFLDAFAVCQNAGGGPRTVAIDWCEWQWDGWMSTSLPVDPRIKEELARQRQLYGLTFDEGMEALCRILASGLPQVLVSTRELATVLRQTHSMAEVLSLLAGLRHQGAGETHARPLLGIPYAPPENRMQRALVEIWQEILGVEPVGIHDNFLQLGGHSLLGLQMASRVREALGLELPLSLLFASPTIAGVAASLGAEEPWRDLPPAPPPIDRAESAEEMLGKVGQLSEEEMDGLLAEILAERGAGNHELMNAIFTDRDGGEDL